MDEENFKEAQLLQSIESNDKLESLNTIAESSLVSQETSNDILKDVSKLMENRIEQADLDTERIIQAIKDKPAIQQVEIKGIEFATIKGEKGDKPSIEELREIIDPLIPTEDDLIKIVKPLIPEPIKGEDGVDGKDYVLTENDKIEIAKSIEVPIVEKIIEKTETIIEKPITIDKTKTEIKEVAKYETAEDIANKINTLSKEIDFKVIKNFPDFSKGGGGLNTVAVDGTTITGNGLGDNPLRVIGGSTGVQSVVAGTNITVDNTDPQNPIINSTGGSGSGDMTKAVYDPANINEQLVGLTATQTLTNKTLDSYTNFIHADGIHLRVKATENLAYGDVLKFVGFNAGQQAIEVAKRDDATVPAIGVLHDTLSTGDFGMAVSNGLFKNINTIAFPEGTVLYPNTTGGFTDTPSITNSNYNQQLAYVVRSHAVNGEIMINVGAGHDLANQVAYDNTTSGLTADNVQEAIDELSSEKLDKNTAITGATKTKITYDADGLVTAGADATTTDINDSTNRRYVTDAQLTVIGNTSGTNTGDVSVTDSAEIDFTLTGQNITASLKAGSIDETKLDTSINASLDLADTAVQSAGLTNYFNKTTDDTDDITEGATNKYNATHTGEVTGSSALTVDKTAITNKTGVTPVGADYILISDTSDSGNLKKALISDLPNSGSGSYTASQGITLTGSDFALGGTINSARLIEVDTGGQLQIDALNWGSTVLNIDTDGNVALKGDDTTIGGETILKVETPTMASATNGDFLQLIDKTTGEVEYAPAPSGGDPFGTVTTITADTTLSTQQVILIDNPAATASIVVTLPAPASTAVGKKYLIAQIDTGIYASEITCVTPGVLRGVPSQPHYMTSQGQFMWWINDGTYWRWVDNDVATKDYVTANFANYGDIKTQVSSIASDITVSLNGVYPALVYLVDTTLGDVTVTLPTSTEFNNTVTIKKVSSDSNKVIVLPDGTENIDGDTSAIISYQYTSATFIGNDASGISIIG